MNLFLFQPTKPFQIFQQFGESKLCYNPATKQFINKTNGVCPPDFVSFYEYLGSKGHTGIDLYAPRWSPIYASASGTVKEVQTEVERGLGVGVVTNQRVLFHADCKEEHYAKYRNWHFIALNVQLGQKVDIGDLLGWADSTGYSTGDHDHFELKAVEYNAKGEHYNAHQDNGYFGAVNPIPYMENAYALDAKNTFQRMLEQLAILSEKLADFLRKRSK